MFILVTYGLTVLTVGALLFIASRQHHVKVDGKDVFRYPPVFRYLFAIAFLFFLGVGSYVNSSYGSPAQLRAGGGEALFSWIACAAFCLSCLWGLIWTLRYSIIISESELIERGVFGRRWFPIRDVGSAVVRQGMRGARDLIVNDKTGNLLLKVGGTIEDFDELARLVRARVGERK